jgi:hypothetical protein
MQNVTEYYANSGTGIFIAVSYLFCLVLLSGLFYASHHSLHKAKQALKRLQEFHEA